MKSDIETYHKLQGNIDMLCITAGVIKDVSSVQIVISTWQSLQKESVDWFNQFTSVLVDEAHGVKAKSLTSIMEKCNNVVYRFGTTGTLDGENVHKLVLQGLFGGVKRVATTTELIESKHLAPLKINAIVLNYKRTDDIKKIKSYQDEIDYLVGNEKRNRFIVDLVKRLDKTTLVLFRYVEKHGKVLHKMLEEQMTDVHYISGEVDGDERETIRHLMETPDKKQVLIGSLQTLSTGVNIKNIHNIVFVAPTKSQITLLQSIGRGLRTHEEKDVLQVYDLVDSFDGKKQNFAVKHFMERVKVYDSEGFDYGVKKFDLDKHY
jgi:superfamily II DNA or RNA helicase